MKTSITTKSKPGKKGLNWGTAIFLISAHLAAIAALFFFSWPAHDKFIFTYPADETNVAWSVPHVKQFLLEIVKESHAQSIHLIAHSMGTRALAAALREIELEMHDQARLFNQVILAAPDIDADEFRTNIAPAMQRTAQRLTLYASARDDALLASRFLGLQLRHCQTAQWRMA